MRKDRSRDSSERSKSFICVSHLLVLTEYACCFSLKTMSRLLWKKERGKLTTQRHVAVPKIKIFKIQSYGKTHSSR